MKILELEQGSQEWIDARIEKISGTRLSDAIGTKVRQESLINELIAERLTGDRKSIYQSEAMTLGTEAEAHAIEEYEIHTGYITEAVGICVHDEHDWLVNSPDRLIKVKDKYVRAVEVKSPNPDTAIKYIRSNKIPKEYEAQVTSYFLINYDLEALDFVIYSPKIQNQYRLWIITVTRDEWSEHITEAQEEIVKFYEKWQNALKDLNLEF